MHATAGVQGAASSRVAPGAWVVRAGLCSLASVELEQMLIGHAICGCNCIRGLCSGTAQVQNPMLIPVTMACTNVYVKIDLGFMTVEQHDVVSNRLAQQCPWSTVTVVLPINNTVMHVHR